MEYGKIDQLITIIEEGTVSDTVNEDVNTGYDINSNKWEVIVKYNGDLEQIRFELDAYVEILNCSYAIITLPAQNIKKLVNYDQIEYVEKPKVLGFMLSNTMVASCIRTVQQSSSYDLKGRGVLVAILDSGIDYAHPDFIDDDGNTRIVYLWDQTIDGNPPTGFKDGYEYTQDDINEALKKETPEERLEIVKSVDFLGHGTGVAGVATGNGRSSNFVNVGAAPESSILIVKIGRKGDRGFARTTEIMRGIKYAIDKAREQNMPVSINISFGTNDGSHDGLSLFETFIDDISEDFKTNIIVASGNEGGASKHFEGTLKNNETTDVEFSVSSNLQSLSINFWQSFTDEFSFQIIGPDGSSTPVINYSRNLQSFNIGNTKIYITTVDPTPYTQYQEVYFTFLPIRGNEVTPGIWNIKINAISIVEGAFNMWLPITEMVSNRTKFLSPKVNTTLTIPSTAFNVITVGGYNSDTNTISTFSGRGYTREVKFIKPDLVAPAVSVLTTAPGGRYSPMTGTSFAAPHVAGAVALLMEWGIVNNNDPFLYGQKVKAYLQLGARRNPNIEYPNINWGYGSLCLANTLNYLERNIFSNRNITSLEVNDKNLNNDKEEIKIDNKNSRYITVEDDYVDLIVRNDSFIQKFVEDNKEDVFIKTLLVDYAILNIPKSKIENYYKTQGKYAIQEEPKLLGLMGRQSLEDAGIIQVQTQPYLNLRGRGTLVAIIDTGVNYRREAFVYENNSTKIEYIWDQSIQSDNPPKDFGYGTEYTKEQINEALKSENPLDIVPHRDNVGHGTFLASVACGREENFNNIGAAPDASLIVVKLKDAKRYLRNENLIPTNVENVFQSNDLMEAIEYVVTKATELRMPLSICISLGTNSGGHDGTSLLEEYISKVAIKNACVISAAVGNEGRERKHMSGKIEVTGESKDIEIQVGPNERGFVLYVYGYEADKLSASVRSPTGEKVERVPVRNNETFETKLIFEKSTVTIGYKFAEEKDGSEEIMIKIKAPTEGIWIVTIFGNLIVDGKFHAWLPISDFISNNTFFLEANPDYTATIPSTADHIISVGGYNNFNNTLYVSTSRGPARNYNLNPSLVAPSVNVEGSLNVGYGTLTGTSVGTAITTGACALLLEWGILEGNEDIFNTVRANSYLIKGCTRRQSITYPNFQWGYGELNLFKSFEVLITN